MLTSLSLISIRWSMYSSTSVSQEYISCIVKRTKKNMVTKVTVLFHIFAMTETGFLLKNKKYMFVLGLCNTILQRMFFDFKFLCVLTSNFTIAILTEDLNRCNDKIYDPDNVCSAGISDHLRWFWMKPPKIVKWTREAMNEYKKF